VSIWANDLTGNQVVLKVGTKVEIGPRRHDGTFLIRTSHGEVGAVPGTAWLEAYPGGPRVAIGPT
jgi:hypothetical protein